MAILALKGPMTQSIKAEKDPRKAIIAENSGMRIETPIERITRNILSMTSTTGCLLVWGDVSRAVADRSSGERGQPFAWS